MLRHIFAAVFRGLTRDWMHHRAARALGSLSDQQLADIGLLRTDVYALDETGVVRRTPAIGRIAPSSAGRFDHSASLLTSASARSRA